VLVRDEDLEAVRAQLGGALVDERALVRREERTGEVDLQGASTLQIHRTFKPDETGEGGDEVLASLPGREAGDAQEVVVWLEELLVGLFGSRQR